MLNCFLNRYRAAGDFDIYPTVAKGGSKAIVNGETMSPQEFKEAVEKRFSKQAVGIAACIHLCSSLKCQ